MPPHPICGIDDRKRESKNRRQRMHRFEGKKKIKKKFALRYTFRHCCITFDIERRVVE